MTDKRVLLIDDDLELRETIATILEDDGYQVMQAAGGKEALATLENPPLPDLLLLDMMMPGMNGWEFLERKNQNPDFASVPVVALTASRQIEGQPLPVQEVVYKPLRLDQLLSIVKRYTSES